MIVQRRVHDPKLMSFVDWVTEIVDSCDFPDYIFHVTADRAGAKIQGSYIEKDVVTGEKSVQFTRKWLVSPHSCESEIVRTVFKCAMTSMEHRTREGFQWRGQRIFGPHIDIYALHAASREVDVRLPDNET